MLGVSVSGYYGWRNRPPSARTLRHAWLAGEIAQVHKDSGGTYGTLRVTAELRYGRGIHVGKEQVHLLMRRLGIYGLPKRRLPRGARIGKAKLARSSAPPLHARRPDRLWMTDITEHPTREGKIYCCAVHRRVLTHGRGLVDRQPPDRAAGHQRSRHGAQPQDPERGRNHTLRSGGAVRILGLQPEGHGSRPGTLPSAPSALRSTMRWSRRSGPACRSSYSTAEDGRHASSSPPRSTTTSKIWHNTRRRHSALQMLTPTEFENHHKHNRPPPDSRPPTPRNPGQINPYVERVFSEQAVAQIPGLRMWLTSEYDHDGLRRDGLRVLGRLLDIARGRI